MDSGSDKNLCMEHCDGLTCGVWSSEIALILPSLGLSQLQISFQSPLNCCTTYIMYSWVTKCLLVQSVWAPDQERHDNVVNLWQKVNTTAH